jgi:hypothetical protein
MKKLIAILTLFAFSLFMAEGQSRITYIDTIKSVQVNVSTEVNKSKPIEDPVQTLFATALENQKDAQKTTKEYLDTLTTVLTTYVNNIEARNKEGSHPISYKFGYDTEDVKLIIRKERWLNFITIALAFIYLLYVNSQLNKRDILENLLGKALIYIGVGIFAYLAARWLLILLFNPGYFMIRELIALYT